MEPSFMVILSISRTVFLDFPDPYDFLALLNTTTGKFFCHSDFGLAGQDCNLAETLLKFTSKSVTLRTEPNFVSLFGERLVASLSPSDKVDAKEVRDEL